MECHPTAVETCFPMKGSEKKRRTRKKDNFLLVSFDHELRTWVDSGAGGTKFIKLIKRPHLLDLLLSPKKKPSGIKHCSFRTEGWNVHSDASPVRLAWFR